MTTTEMQIFEDLTDAEAAAIFALFPVLEVPPGHEVVQQGATDTAVFVVLKGAFEVSFTDAAGVSHALAQLDVGTVFGELSFLDDMPRSASVRAVADAQVLRLDREAFGAFSGEHPSAAAKVYRDLGRVVARRLRLSNERAVRTE